MKHIFISRNLKPTSPIRGIIGHNHLIAQSLLQFSALEFEEPQADWIFFYSRNGVKYFFENGNYALYPYLWACMSEGTADELSHYVMDIAFIGKGTPEEVALSYKNSIQSDDVTCFIRAENSLNSIYKKLANPNDFSLSVYQNTPITNIPEQDFDILIFTSPMNVDAWFKKKDYHNEKVISIGETTAQHLSTYGIVDVLTAESPSENSLAKSLLLLL